MEQKIKPISQARFQKYNNACGNITETALRLHDLNFLLSKELYVALAYFEVILRNAINDHYVASLSDRDWIKTYYYDNPEHSNVKIREFLEHTRNKVKFALSEVSQNYSNDKLVSKLSFGFWVSLFKTTQFKYLGHSVHKIFVNHPIKFLPKDIYNRLNLIKNMRNRIAHHESICFNKAGQIDTTAVTCSLDEIKFFTGMLGYDYDSTIGQLEEARAVIQRIEILKESL